MNLKVLVWNMNYWLSSHRNEGWDFIREVVEDSALYEISDHNPIIADFIF